MLKAERKLVQDHASSWHHLILSQGRNFAAESNQQITYAPYLQELYCEILAQLPMISYCRYCNGPLLELQGILPSVKSATRSLNLCTSRLRQTPTWTPWRGQGQADSLMLCLNLLASILTPRSALPQFSLRKLSCLPRLGNSGNDFTACLLILDRAGAGSMSSFV